MLTGVKISALRRPHDLDELVAVLDHHADVVTGFQAQRTKQLRALVGAAIQLPESDHLARGAHDDGGFVRVSLRGNAGMGHGYSSYRMYSAGARLRHLTL